jgi:hypothetical protein
VHPDTGAEIGPHLELMLEGCRCPRDQAGQAPAEGAGEGRDLVVDFPVLKTGFLPHEGIRQQEKVPAFMPQAP